MAEVTARGRQGRREVGRGLWVRMVALGFGFWDLGSWAGLGGWRVGGLVGGLVLDFFGCWWRWVGGGKGCRALGCGFAGLWLASRCIDALSFGSRVCTLSSWEKPKSCSHVTSGFRSSFPPGIDGWMGGLACLGYVLTVHAYLGLHGE